MDPDQAHRRAEEIRQAARRHKIVSRTNLVASAIEQDFAESIIVSRIDYLIGALLS